MLPMRFEFYQDIERARHNPFELDVLHEQIVGCGNGFEGDLFHLAHVPGVHTKSIICNAIERAEEEGEPLYAALMVNYLSLTPKGCAEGEACEYKPG